jgi:hypothetical protein
MRRQAACHSNPKLCADISAASTCPSFTVLPGEYGAATGSSRQLLSLAEDTTESCRLRIEHIGFELALFIRSIQQYVSS